MRVKIKSATLGLRDDLSTTERSKEQHVKWGDQSSHSHNLPHSLSPGFHCNEPFCFACLECEIDDGEAEVRLLVTVV